MNSEELKKLEALLDTALEHFSHGWRAMENEGQIAYIDPDVFPPSVRNGVGTVAYHFAAVADTVKRAYELTVSKMSDEERGR